MSDQLDSLTDAALSEVFAVEVAKEKPERLAFASNDNGKSGSLFESSRFGWDPFTVSRAEIERYCREYPEYKVVERDVYRTPFATSADAVTPFLEKVPECVTLRSHKTSHRWFVSLGEPGQAVADTFARAACIALIRRARAEKGASA